MPPATHTNSWILGDHAWTVVDPASPWEDEQARLFREIEAGIGAGATVRRLFLTHHHHDHVSGAVDLQQRLRRIGCDVPIAAHPITAELVRGRIPVDELVEHGADLEGVRAHFTPGHAPGHLVLHHETEGWVIAGDMVAGVGTIVLDPDEGDLQQYLDSLALVRGLGATALMPAHGPVLTNPEAILAFYTAHRHQRSEQIREALDRVGRATPLELAPRVYPELPAEVRPLAAAQILTHLKWLGRHGLVRPLDGGSWTTG